MQREGRRHSRRRRDSRQLNQSMVAFPWQDLHGDLQLEILSRLPPKSLLRFKCVCKYWFSLFSDPSFIHKHVLHRASTACSDDNDNTLLIHGSTSTAYSDDNDNTLLTRYSTSSSLLNLKDPSNPVTFNLNQFADKNNLGDMNLVGSINGLVCLSSGWRPDIWNPKLILWNPTTKQYTNIPTPNIKLPDRGGYFTIGFCFDSLTNDYKIVRFIKLVPPRAEVYSVSADCWREIEVGISSKSEHRECDTIVRGEPYWLASAYSVDQSTFVVWFDACEEVFRKGPPLLTSRPNKNNQRLGNFENSLAMLNSLEMLTRRPEIMFSLLVMEDKSSAWSTKFSAKFSVYFWQVGCSKNGEIVFSDGLGMKLYNPKTNETSNIQIDLGSSFRSFRVSDYAASLIPVRKSKQAEKEETTGGSDSYISAPQR